MLKEMFIFSMNHDHAFLEASEMCVMHIIPSVPLGPLGVFLKSVFLEISSWHVMTQTPGNVFKNHTFNLQVPHRVHAAPSVFHILALYCSNKT